MEEWKVIPGFEKYRINKKGDIVVIKTYYPLRHQVVKKGYKTVVLYDRNMKRFTFYVHRLVMLAFVGPCPNKLEVCHNDGNPDNNHLSNLRYDTHLNNMREGKTTKHGRYFAENKAKKIKEKMNRNNNMVYDYYFNKIDKIELSKKYHLSIDRIQVILRKVAY